MTRPPFSDRTGWDLAPNALGQSLARARASGRQLIDLTASNPTRCGLSFGAEEMVAELGHARGVAYVPDAHGHPDALVAVSAYYAERDLQVPASTITLTASTSEAYGWLFKLLTNPGDNVLVPTPSYPLFGFFGDLECVSLQSYELLREEGYRVDRAGLEASIDARTRAILVVHPNNPTGTFTRRDDARFLVELCQARGLALIVDEVFGDFARGALPPDRRPSFAGEGGALTFVLSGLSKVLAQPQLKLGWILTSGPESVAAEARARLEVIADTYLSVATPVQRALPALLQRRASVQATLRERVAQNLAALDRAIAEAGEEAPVRRLPTDGGWYAILEVPRTRTEDEWVDLLIESDGVVVHPGYFFEMDRGGYWVISLLPEPGTFAEGVRRLVRAAARG